MTTPNAAPTSDALDDFIAIRKEAGLVRIQMINENLDCNSKLFNEIWRITADIMQICERHGATYAETGQSIDAPPTTSAEPKATAHKPGNVPAYYLGLDPERDELPYISRNEPCMIEPPAHDAPKAAATRWPILHVGDHVQHRDGTTGTVVNIGEDADDFLEVRLDHSRSSITMWWSRSATVLIADDGTLR